MKKLIAGALLSFAAINGAFAADLPARSEPYAPPPAASPIGYNWTGFYAGLHAGYGWASYNAATNALVNKPRGFVAGGQAGYNYQMQNFVIGAEGDIYWSGMSGKRTLPGPVLGKGDVEWAGSLRVRAGFAADRALVYATGGYAFAQVKASVLAPAAIPTPVSVSSSSMRHGWTLGGGIEYAFTNNISGKAEYLYSSYASKTVVGRPFTISSAANTSVIRAGFNYHF